MGLISRALLSMTVILNLWGVSTLGVPMWPSQGLCIRYCAYQIFAL